MDTDEPMLRVERGDPTAEELAALVAVLSRRAARAPTGVPHGPSRWIRSARPGARATALPAARGPGAWRASALPS